MELPLRDAKRVRVHEKVPACADAAASDREGAAGEAGSREGRRRIEFLGVVADVLLGRCGLARTLGRSVAVRGARRTRQCSVTQPTCGR